MLLVLLASVFALYAIGLTNPTDREARVNHAALPGAAPHVRLAPFGYDIGHIRTGRAGVPRLFLQEMPADYAEIETIAERKREFLHILLPLVLLTNEEILAERHQMLEIRALVESGQEIPAAAASWLTALGEKYEAAPTDFDALLTRVDAVSPAVTLSQAIEETGWGRSRFVQEGNALFGQRTWARGDGIVPTARAPGKSFEVQKFGSLLESVRAYAVNLNTHPAYADYRNLRAELRALGRLNPARLADTLLLYSERGRDYIQVVQRVMRDNQLQHFETVELTKIAAPVRLAARAAGFDRPAQNGTVLD